MKKVDKFYKRPNKTNKQLVMKFWSKWPWNVFPVLLVLSLASLITFLIVRSVLWLMF
jgi:hypothetical protein